MMRNPILKFAASTCMALALAACGGGGGGGSKYVATTPPPPPPPPPPPLPTGPFLIPSATQSAGFAVLGWEESTGDKTIADLETAGFGVRYDAAAKAYFVDLPSGAEAPFTPKAVYESGAVNGTLGTEGQGYATFLSSSAQFTKAAVAEIQGPAYSFLVFGVPTAPAAMPVAGSASYSANLQGTIIGYGSPAPYVYGSASFSFDFAAGTLSGGFSPHYSDGWGTNVALGTYDFVNTVYSSGATTFSGGLLDGTTGLTGSFAGLFTGPAANELMASWSLIAPDPYGTGTAQVYGVLAGRKDGGP